MQCSNGTFNRWAAALNTSGDGLALATSSPVMTTALAPIPPASGEQSTDYAVGGRRALAPTPKF